MTPSPRSKKRANIWQRPSSVQKTKSEERYSPAGGLGTVRLQKLRKDSGGAALRSTSVSEMALASEVCVGCQSFGFLLPRWAEFQNLTLQDLVEMCVDHRRGRLPHPAELATNVRHGPSLLSPAIDLCKIEPHLLQRVFL